MENNSRLVVGNAYSLEENVEGTFLGTENDKLVFQVNGDYYPYSKRPDDKIRLSSYLEGVIILSQMLFKRKDKENGK